MAERIATGVQANPCSKCGASDKFSQWQGDEGNSWLSCSRRIDGKFCNGKPLDDKDLPATGAPAREQEGRPEAESSPQRSHATSSSSASGSYSSLFRAAANALSEAADGLARASVAFAELSERTDK